MKESALGRSLQSNIQSPVTESVSNLIVQVVLEKGIGLGKDVEQLIQQDLVVRIHRVFAALGIVT